jgi:polar amino acid transport system substrate-binding protein
VDYDDQLKNFKGLKMGISRGYVYTDAFDKADYLTKIPVQGPGRLMEKLLNKELDIIVIAEQVANDLLKEKSQQEVAQIRALSPPLISKKLYIMISKKHPDGEAVVADFNKGLKHLAIRGKLSELIP